MNDLRKDSELVSEQDIRLRIRSLENQIDKEEYILNPKNWNKHHDKLCKLNARKDSLLYRLALLLKSSKVEL